MDGIEFKKPQIEIILWTVLGQLLGFATLPILATLVGEELLGEYGAIASLVVFAAPIIALRSEVVTPPLLEAQRVSYGSLAITTSMVIGVASGACSLIYFGVGEGGVYIATHALPITLLVFASAVSMPFLGEATAQKKYKEIGFARVFWIGFGAVIQVLLVYLVGPSFAVMVYGLAISRILGVWILSRATITRRWKFNLKEWVDQIADIAKSHIHQILQGSSAAFFNGAALHVPILLVGALWGPGCAGQFYIANMLARGPSSIMVHGLNRVYCGKFAETKTDGRSALFKRQCASNLLIGLLCLCPLALICPFLIDSFFGEDWSLALQMFFVLLPAALLQLVASPIAGTLLMMGKSKTQLRFDFARSAVALLGILACSQLDLGPVIGLMTYSLSMSGFDAGYLCITHREIKSQSVHIKHYVGNEA